MVIGPECRGSLYTRRTDWHRPFVNDLRALRRSAGLSQRAFAELIGVALNSFRMWDSGLRPAPVPMLRRAREALDHRAHQHELLPLDRLASELGVHVRTLQAAARTGRLDVRFSTRSVFGRPLRLGCFRHQLLLRRPKLFPAGGAWQLARHHPRDRVDAY